MLKTYMDTDILHDFFLIKRPEPIPHGNEIENKVWSNLWTFLKNATELHLSGELNQNISTNIFLTQLTTGRGEAQIFTNEKFKRPHKNEFQKSQSPYSLFFLNDDDAESQRKYRKNNSFFFGFFNDYYEKWEKLNIEFSAKQQTISKTCIHDCFRSWDELNDKFYILSDAILCDNYILKDMNLWQSNLIPIIKALFKKASKGLNLLIYSYEGANHELLGKIDDIFGQLKNEIEDNKISCKLGIILAPNKFRFKPRRIFSNYLFIRSDDTFNYFDSSGKIITKETEIDFNPITSIENFKQFKNSLHALYQKSNEIINNRDYEKRYTRGNLKNRLFELFDH